jgi:hypothetical protein
MHTGHTQRPERIELKNIQYHIQLMLRLAIGTYYMYHNIQKEEADMASVRGTYCFANHSLVLFYHFSHWLRLT